MAGFTANQWVEFMKKLKVTRKPDGKGFTGRTKEDGSQEEVNRTHLAEIVDEDGNLVDSAYFPTVGEAQQWASDLYKL